MTGKRNQSSPVGSPLSGNISDTSSKEQDRFLPIANVSRIMKKSLPANAKISKEAKETVQECVSEFISFITGEASDKCQREKRKTINGDDLLWAMTTLGFENYVGPLKDYLNRYRETEGEKNSMVRQEDHPSPKNHGACTASSEISQVNASLSTDAIDHLYGFNGGFHAHGAQVTAKNYRENSSFVGYPENLVGVGASFNMINNGERNGNGVGVGVGVVAAQLHHGVEW